MTEKDLLLAFASYDDEKQMADNATSKAENLNRWQRIIKAFCTFKGIPYDAAHTNQIVNKYIKELYAISHSYELYRKGTIEKATFWKNQARNAGIEFVGKETLGGFGMPTARYTYTTKGLLFVDILESHQEAPLIAKVYNDFKDYILWGETLIESALSEFETFFKLN